MKDLIPEDPEEVVEVASILQLLVPIMKTQANSLKILSERLIIESGRLERVKKIIEEILRTSSYCKWSCHYLIKIKGGSFS